MVIYTLFVLVEMILHLIRHFRYQKAEGETLMHAQKMDIRLTLLMDLLQLPLSLIFTRFLNLFSAVILVFGEAYPNQLAKLCRRSQTRYIRVWDLPKTVLTSSTSVSRSQSDWSVRDI